MNATRPLVILLFALAARPARGQALAYLLGDEAGSNASYGLAVGDAGDVDADGTPDVIVGAPYQSPGGSVFVYSGRSGALIWTMAGENPGDAFGAAVDGIGDINGDGRSEVIVSAPYYEFPGGPVDAGKIYVISGTGTQTILSTLATQAQAYLASSVHGLGDLNGDGINEYGYGAGSYDYAGLTNCGRVTVVDGSSFAPLFTLYGSQTGGGLGTRFDVVRATGSQATSRLIVGAPGINGGGVGRGEAYVLDGFGNVLTTITGKVNGAQLGLGVAGVGDVDADGTADYAIGAPFTNVLGASFAGALRVYSGSSGLILYTLNGTVAGAQFGREIAPLGDFNGDGYPDFLMGAPDYDAGGIDQTGLVRVVSGLDGSTLASHSGALGERMGRGLSSAGDLNGDGVADYVFGVPGAASGAGQAQVHLSGVADPTVYCAAKVNSQGCTPQVTWQGLASLSIADSFHVGAQSVLNQKPGLLFWGYAPAALPFQGGTLCVQPPLRRTATQFSNGATVGSDCSGTYDFWFSQAYLGAAGILAGDRIHAQYWSRDPLATFQAGLTDAVAFDVAP